MFDYSAAICVMCVFPCHGPLCPLLSKGEHGIFDMCNDRGASCALESETGTDESKLQASITGPFLLTLPDLDMPRKGHHLVFRASVHRNSTISFLQSFTTRFFCCCCFFVCFFLPQSTGTYNSVFLSSVYNIVSNASWTLQPIARNQLVLTDGLSLSMKRHCFG